MSIVQDVPSELKQFAKVFDQLCYRNGDYGKVFSDFIDYWTAGMLVHGDKQLAESLQTRYKDDYPMFNKLVVEMISVYSRKLSGNRGWYDGFGTFYEVISSARKSSYLGQFFTPECIADLMTMQVEPKPGNSVADCACGSGRLLISVKAKAPEAVFYGADLDPVCTKMTALNLGLHGCVGEVSCMDSIRVEWWFGYNVNPLFRYKGTPPVAHLIPIRDFSDSKFYIREITQAPKDKTGKHGQLVLF